MKNLCIIPARGGSKRIPRKNIKLFLGKPIIAYSIEAALKSGIYEEVMVSTDDDEISAIAKQYGAKVPFYRSPESSNDYAVTADVIREVLSNYLMSGRSFDNVTCLYSTAPFVSAERLRESLNMLNNEIHSVFTCVAFSFPIQRALHLVGGLIEMVDAKYMFARTQDLEPTYHDAGQFYTFTVDFFNKYQSLWGENTAGIFLSDLEAQDIDNMSDWKLAEIKYTLLHSK